MKEAGDHKEQWYEWMKDKGLRVKLAKNDNGLVAGMIHYLPMEYSMFEGGACMQYSVNGFTAINRESEISRNREWGISDSIFIDGKDLRTRPGPAYKKIHRESEERAGRIKPAPEEVEQSPTAALRIC